MFGREASVLVLVLLAGCSAAGRPSEPSASFEPTTEALPEAPPPFDEGWEWVDYDHGLFRSARVGEMAWVIEAETTNGTLKHYWVNATDLGSWTGHITCEIDYRKGIHQDVPAGLSYRRRCDDASIADPEAWGRPEWSAAIDLDDASYFGDFAAWGILEYRIEWEPNHAPSGLPDNLNRTWFSLCQERGPYGVCDFAGDPEQVEDRTIYIGYPLGHFMIGYWMSPGEYDVWVKPFQSLLMDWSFTLSARAYCCAPVIPSMWEQEPWLSN